jgi:hypothetical protein
MAILDPLLAGHWLAKVGEAQSLLSRAASDGVQLCRSARGRNRCEPVATLHGAKPRLDCACGATSMLAHRDLVQLRGAYAGSMLAAPALASLIVAARRRGPGLAIAAWMGCAGVLYPIAAQATNHRDTAPDRRSCSDPLVIARLAELPPGVLLAPIDTGAWALVATRHRVVAGPYHRNQAGMLATLRFYRGGPEQARSVAETGVFATC